MFYVEPPTSLWIPTKDVKKIRTANCKTVIKIFPFLFFNYITNQLNKKMEKNACKNITSWRT